jgi:hypothetical protein
MKAKARAKIKKSSKKKSFKFSSNNRRKYVGNVRNWQGETESWPISSAEKMV